jgi:cell division protein FtsA
VLTGGGALLKHLPQLTEFITGMDTRIGYPNEHLANNVSDELASPMYATGIGLVIEGMRRYYKENEALKEKGRGKEAEQESVEEQPTPSRSFSFLKKIQEFFEKDDIQ